MNVRKFSLRNSIGDILDLNGEQGCYLFQPTGLGYSLDPTYISMDHGFYKNVSNKKEPQGEVAGILFFTGVQPFQGPYDCYNYSVNWINKSKSLELVYTIPFIGGEKSYYSQVELINISKGELDTYGILRCNVTFRKLTPWYDERPIEVTVSADEPSDIEKRYTYGYEHRYAASAFGAGVELSTNGHLPGGLKVVVPGPFYSVDISLYDATKTEKFGEMYLYKAVPAGSELIFTSLYNESEVKVGDEDVISEVKLPNNVFFKIPLDTNCLLKIDVDSSTSNQTKVMQYDYFRGV